MKFLLDMGISYQVAAWLNLNGHDAIHISLEGLHTLEDIHIMQKATNENRIILTSDMDFGKILAFSESSSVSVIQFRLFDLSPSNVVSKLNLALDKFHDVLEADAAIVTIQEHKIRLKILPL